MKVGVFVDAENIKYNGGYQMRYDVLRRFAARDGGFPLRLNTYMAFDPERAKEDPDYDNPNMNVGSVSIPALKKKKGCYLTTAVMMTRGAPDDCEELEVLRAFRDGYLLAKPNGPQLVQTYYEHAPLILEEIAKQPDPAAIYCYLYEVIRFCVDAIDEGMNELAYRTYCHMVVEMKERFIPDVAVEFQL